MSRKSAYSLLVSAVLISGGCTVLFIYSRFSEVFALLTILAAIGLVGVLIRDGLRAFRRR